MTEFIFEEFKQGVILQIHDAEKNVFIWQHIADEIEFLQAQPEDVQQLYSFLQFASQTNFVLAVGKLFDKPKKHPSQSILYFLKQVERRAEENVEIVEDSSTKKLLAKYNASDILIKAVDSDDRSVFPKEFVTYYNAKYNSQEIQADLEQVKFMRDKVVAHNESIEYVGLEFKAIHRLLKFATEIVTIFGMAYHSTIWESDKTSLITESAKRNAWFVKLAIQRLKSL